MFRKALTLICLPLITISCERAATTPAEIDHRGADGLSASVSSSSGLVRTTWPTVGDPGLPFYARIEPAPPHVFVVDGWAVISFYRDPACISATFNLLSFFDAPAAFGCPHAVTGSNLWHGQPFAGAPKIVQVQGAGAVPFWFIPANLVLDAVADGVLTIGELEAMEGRLTGLASQFSETLHPHPNPPFLGGGGHPVPKLMQTARGTLSDGRAFNYQLTVASDQIRSIQLQFR
jgi:hypothetical protein